MKAFVICKALYRVTDGFYNDPQLPDQGMQF